MSTDARRSRGRLKRAAIAILLVLSVLFVTLTIVGWYAYSLTQREPSWWANAAIANTEDARTRAGQLEQGVSAALHDSRDDGEPWSVRVRDADINAWLTHRLEPWLANRSMETPEDFEPPRLRVENGRVAVGLPSPDPRFEGILTVEFTPAMSPDGRLVAEDRSFAIGRLPLPDPGALGGVSAELRRAARGTPAEPFIGALLDAGTALPSEITLSDRRVVSLRDVTLKEGGQVDLTLVTKR